MNRLIEAIEARRFSDANTAIRESGTASNIKEMVKRVGNERVYETTVRELYEQDNEIEPKQKAMLLISRANLDADFERTPITVKGAIKVLEKVLAQAITLLDQDGLFIMEIPTFTFSDAATQRNGLAWKNVLRDLQITAEVNGHYMWVQHIDSNSTPSNILSLRK